MGMRFFSYNQTMKLRYLLEFYATIGIPLLYLFILAMVSYGGTIETPLAFQTFGIVATFMGLFFWIISYLQLGRGFGVLPRRQKRVTQGLYSRYKHPMYIGITLTFFGLSLANQSFWGIISTIFLLLPILLLRAKIEEKHLLD